MAFNINTFKARGLTSGGARPSLFSVRIPLIPPGLNVGATDIEFLISAASLPPSTVDLIEVPYFGRRIKVAGERIFQNWQVSVLNDEDFELRNLFESWSNKINTHVSNRFDIVSTPNEYKVNEVEVLQYGKAGPGDESGVIRSYTFWGVWPVNIDAIPLDWGRTNQIETFDVTFAIDYWVPRIGGASGSYATDIDGSAPPIVVGPNIAG